MAGRFEITANLVDLFQRTITPATVSVCDGVISSIAPVHRAEGFLLPGFVDAHVHIESSMLLPSRFAPAAVVHGTVATVSDPHEIANVCGVGGVEFMLDDAASTRFHFHFGAPSCVPATEFETAGAAIGTPEVETLLKDERVNHLAEVMNFPAVIAGQHEVLDKLNVAKSFGVPIDGHAPGLRGEEMQRYFAAGISTDHECIALDEAQEKLAIGCKIAIREGSAARNFDALWPLIDAYPHSCMFCSDDKHPDDLLLGHINQHVIRAVEKGCDLFNVLQVATRNAIEHYQLPVGLLREGDPADFIVVEDLERFHVRATFIQGHCVARNGESRLSLPSTTSINQFERGEIEPDALAVPCEGDHLRIIEVADGQLITQPAVYNLGRKQHEVCVNVGDDVLKLVVVNRYQNASPAVAFVRGFQLREGALASSVAHDSHNIIAVGTSDVDLSAAVNSVIAHQGGLAVARGGVIDILPLPIGGLMSTKTCVEVAEDYCRLDALADQLGCTLRSPFMTLSFLALPVIPHLKLTDKGLFDVDRFELVSLFC